MMQMEMEFFKLCLILLYDIFRKNLTILLLVPHFCVPNMI